MIPNRTARQRLRLRKRLPARHPGPADLHIVVEVADSTLRSDRVAKAALYARAGIGEYWIVDIVGRQLFVHRQPLPNGYADIHGLQPGRVRRAAGPSQ